MKPTGFLPVLAALSAFSLPAHATNLFPGGDFTSAGVKIGALAFANGGKVSLFQEEFTWNKCGMLEVGAPITNKEGHVTWSATALVGSSDGKARGMAVKGGMTYDFKVELRADREIRAGISLFAWKEGEWKDAVSAVVPVDSDYSVPFVPRESFSPTEKIELTAAVNERVGLPVAVLNLTDRAEEYVVRLETSTFDPDPNKPWADKQMNGSWGLKGFPASQIVARHALRLKDTDAEPVTLRLEPLPKMDEACAIHVPPKEASPRKTGGVRNEQHVGQT